MDEAEQLSGEELQEFLNNIPEEFNILEEEIDINLQMEYFELSRKVKQDDTPFEIIQKDSDLLYSNETDNETKKILLAKLASFDEPSAFRIIEKYLKNCESDMLDFAKLARYESKSQLESSLLGENKVFISSGLGGKDNKLRYFMVLFSKNKESFSDTQKKVINNEFEMSVNTCDGVLEKTDFDHSYVKLLLLLPLRIDLKTTFKNTIKECNQFGNFLKDNFLITNVKTLTNSEIEDFLTKR
ncbi:MAG: hypothetical protein A2046_01270 [Bacteroidetes bacterium GWA2_30_7]|nr:MAG: hypothetical protein A2046_01270 [Bacteroidetes bacterium GWA2_30_7]